MVPSIAPEYIRFLYPDGRDTPFRDAPEWGSAVVQSPWAAYRFGGDPAILARAYPAMVRYLAYLEARSVGGILDVGLGDWYDIGPAPPGAAQLTSRAFTGTAIWYADLLAAQRIATILGRGAAAVDFAARAARVKATTVARFFDVATGRYDRGSQTASAMALVLDLAPPGRADAVLSHLVADIRARGDHVSAGDVGFHYVVRALARHAPERLLAMLARRDAPSYGAQLARGATTLTEAWDANPASSQNHFMLGHAMAWFYTGVAGIDLDFARGADDALVLAPPQLPGIGGAAATLASALGTIGLRWRIAGGRMAIDATVPAGTTARLCVPTSDGAAIREGGRPVRGSTAVRRLPSGAVGSTAFRLGSGTYRFDVPVG